MILVWARYVGTTGRHAAHLHIDGRQACHYQHGGRVADAGRPYWMERAELSAHGVPYGRTCSRCCRLFQRLARRAA